MVDPGKALELSKLLHERARLGIMTVLCTREDEADFNELRSLLGLSKGNLAVHVSKLEAAGYVAVHKSFEGRIPRTTYRCTPLGRRHFDDYLQILEEVIAGARSVTGTGNKG